ncbi:hypothetical protein Emag_003423 [Eimeria magna]
MLSLLMADCRQREPPCFPQDSAKNFSDSSRNNREGSEGEQSAGDEAADAEGFVVLDCEEDEEDVAFYKQREVREGTLNLADLVMQQLRKQEEGGVAPEERQQADAASSLSPKVVEVYTAMAPFLARYRSGKMPKAFKIIPRLHAWEEVLVLTNPPLWSKQALREATRIFCSNLREAMAQRFLCTILLPAVRDDIAENKKLNYHLYMALKKGLFKPGAFFKGIYLPLAIDGCTIREAVIVGSVVAKVSIPVLHGAAALCRLAAMTPEEWAPTAIDEFNLSVSHRAKLKEVLKSHFHEKVGPEIRRELAAQQPALLLEQQQQSATGREHSD